MGERWRYLDLGRQGPFENGATMPVLVRSVAEGHGTIAQTSAWGVTHLNVGWFDDVDATLDLARCAELGVTWYVARCTAAARPITRPSARPCGAS